MSTGYSQDAATMPQASVDFDYDAIHFDDEREEANMLEEKLEEIISQRAEEKTKTALIKFIAILIDSEDYKLKLDVAIAALGFPFHQGISFTSMGVRHNITKQAFSKRVRKFQDEFALPPTNAQKSIKAREKYREAQLKRSKKHD